MKRLVIICGIVAIVVFVVYQFIFSDRRSRLEIDQTAYASVTLDEPVIAPVKSIAIERKLMKEAFVNFQVDDISETKNSINTLIRQADAYISSHKEDEYNEGPQYETVVRVPSSQLDDFIDKLEPLARKMKSKSLSSQDVTDEYVDISARITTKQELEKHYREILRKATKVSEMLEVEQQLEIVRGEIESMEARIEYINNHTDYSIVTITYYQHVISTDGESFSQKVASSFVTGWSGLLAFVVAMLSAWPLLIFGPVVLWISVRLARKWQLFPQQPISKV